MDERKIWYLCDGEKPDCKKSHCYKNTDDDPCRRTSDIEHALNFQKEKFDNDVCYMEKAEKEVE